MGSFDSQKTQIFVSRRLVIDTITNPDLIDYSRRPLIIAQLEKLTVGMC